MEQFPHYTQQLDMSCGAACLRMIASWLTGRYVAEKEVRDDAGWTERGLPARKMGRALARLTKAIDGITAEEMDGADLQRLPSLDVDRLQLLLLASYTFEPCCSESDGPKAIPRNVGHWVIARRGRRVGIQISDRRRARPRGDRTDINVFVVHDPLCESPYFQSWRSLVGTPILYRYDIQHSNRSST